MKRIFILLSSAIMIFSCGRGVGSREEGVTEVVNYSALEEETLGESLLKKWDFEFLSLGADSSGLGLLSRIGKIVYFDGGYFVLDPMRCCLIHFSESGEPVSRIGMLGRGENEYLTINDFGVSPSGRVTIFDGQADCISQYDTAGNFIRKVPMRTEWGKIHYCPGSEEVLLGREPWDDSGLGRAKLVLCDTSFSPVRILSDYMEGYDNNFVFPYIGFSDFAGKVSFVSPIDDNVYVFDSEGGRPSAIKVDFGSFRVEDDAKTNIEDNLSEIMSSRIFLLNAVYLNEGFLAIDMLDRGEMSDVIIDMPGKKRYNMSSSGLRLLGASHDRVFFQVDSLPGKESGLDLPEGMKADFEAGNPVILVLKYRS